MYQEIYSLPSAEDAAEQETCTRTVGAGEGASMQYRLSKTRRDTDRTEVKQPSATCFVQFSVQQVFNNDLKRYRF